MFTSYVEEVRAILDDSPLKTKERFVNVDPAAPAWPRNEYQIILKGDTAIEVGSPDSASVSFLLPTEDASLVHDGRMTIIGPDFPACSGQSIPFGKVILIACHGFDEDNFFSRHQEMFLQRFSLDLDGYSPRSIPQAGKEWSRVSKKALANGFSLEVLGNELYRELSALEYVDAVEIAFVTSTAADVNQFKSIAERSNKALSALNKMAEHLVYDCKNCDYQDVCNEVDGLRRMHERSLKDA